MPHAIRFLVLPIALGTLSFSAHAGPPAKVDICHYTGSGSSHIITVSAAALPAFIAQGDHLVADEICDSIDNDCDGVIDNLDGAFDYGDYDWVEYGGHLYAATINVGPWEAARDEAKAICGDLVVVDDELENAWLTEQFDLVSDITDHSGNVIWIGLVEQNGAWTWVDGSPITYTPFCEYCFREPGPHGYLHTASHWVPGTWNFNVWHDDREDHYVHGVIELR